MVYSNIGEFNNSQEPYRNLAKPQVSCATVSSFNNNVVSSKSNITLSKPNQSSVWFNNSVDILKGVEKPKVIVGSSSVEGWFNNLYSNDHYYTMGDWSVGVFDLANKIVLLQYPEYSIEQVREELLWPTLTYNWFDNSVPSINTPLQFTNIPWGDGSDILQFSINFPAESLELQTNVAAIDKNNCVGISVFATPPIKGRDLLDYQYVIELNKYNLELQSWLGGSTLKVLETQSEVLPDRTERLNTQYIVKYPSKDSLGLQSAFVFNDTDPLEVTAEVSGVNNREAIDIQYTRAYNVQEGLEVQNEVLPDVVSILGKQVKVYVDIEGTLDVQSTFVWNDSSSLDLQYKKVYNIPSEVNLQALIPSVTNSNSVDMSWYATPPIDTDSKADISYKVDYTTSDSVDVAVNVDRFIQWSSLDIMWLQDAKIEYPLDISVLTVVESKALLQGRVVPYGSNLTSAQMKLLATHKSNLEVGFDVVVTKEEVLNSQASVIINTSDAIELCVWNDVWKEYNLDTQINVEEVTKGRSVDLQCILKETIEEYLEEQVNVVVNTDSSIEVSAMVDVAKAYPLDLSTFVSVCKEYGLDMKYAISEITKSNPMDLQFDILDLVYYMLYEGYNLVPWWSDGLGKWDTTVERNWDKEDTSSTMADNLVQQLNDLELDVEVSEMLDVGTRNFMYYQNLLNAGLSNNVLKLVNMSGTSKYLTLGKSKRDKESTITLLKGDNVFFYDGAKDRFNEAIRSNLGEKLAHAVVWKPKIGEWYRLEDDFDLYFYEDVGGKSMPMPYVFILNVSEDCTIQIER